MFKDPIVEEVRAARQKHAAKFDYNLKKIVRNLRKRQENAGRESVSFPPKCRKKMDIEKTISELRKTREDNILGGLSIREMINEGRP